MDKGPGFPRVESYVKVIVYDAFPALFVLGEHLLETMGLLRWKAQKSTIHKVYGREELIAGEDGREDTRYHTSGIRKEETAVFLSALFKVAMRRGNI